MATEFQMPKLGLTMEAGTILEWLVPDGSEVAAGQAVLRIETDKVETDIESSGAGILSQLGEVGETYDCGVRIGWFLAEGESAPAGGTAGSSAPTAAPATATAAVGTSGAVPPIPAAGGASRGAGGRILASPNAKRVAAARGVDLGSVVGSGPGGRIVSEDVEAAAAAGGASRGAGGRILASPNAKRVAAARGVDLGSVVGSGPGGRIVSEDVEAAARRPAPAPVSVPVQPVGPASGASVRTLATFGARNLADLLGIDLATVPSVTGDPRLTRDDVVVHVRHLLADSGAAGGAEREPAAGPTEHPLLQSPSTVVPLRGMRGTIASRMHESLQQMAQLTLMIDVEMSAVVADRDRRKEAAGTDPVPGYTDYVIAAVAAALAEHPYVNSQVTEDGVAHLPEIHVGMAVALDNGLVVPVVRDTPSLRLAELAAETSRLADAARSGKLQLADLEGGTFSVTALGMFGVDGFTPVINPPNTAILGVGRLRDGVRWDGDTPVRTRELTLSLTWDHRAFDGAPAAEFAGSVKRHLEACDLS
jgi:pyruvate dehydrogenase E2 component (dihydrolipoamide acetyltransferase)